LSRFFLSAQPFFLSVASLGGLRIVFFGKERPEGGSAVEDPDMQSPIAEIFLFQVFLYSLLLYFFKYNININD